MNEGIVDRCLRGVLDQGILHMINLMEPDEVSWWGYPFIPCEDTMKAPAGDACFESFP